MNDKVAPMAPTPASTPSKDTPADTKVAQPGKDQEAKPKAQQDQTSAAKS